MKLQNTGRVKNVGVGDKARLHFVVDKLSLTYAILILHVDPPHIYENVHILQNHSYNQTVLIKLYYWYYSSSWIL